MAYIPNPEITQTDANEFTVANLSAEGVAYLFLHIDSFTVQIKREGEGLVVDVLDPDGASVASTYAFDSDMAGDA